MPPEIDFETFEPYCKLMFVNSDYYPEEALVLGETFFQLNSLFLGFDKDKMVIGISNGEQ